MGAETAAINKKSAAQTERSLANRDCPPRVIGAAILLQVATRAVTNPEVFTNSKSKAGSGRRYRVKTGFGVEPTGTLRSVPNGFAVRGEHRLP